jgi:hypothetical protein
METLESDAVKATPVHTVAFDAKCNHTSALYRRLTTRLGTPVWAAGSAALGGSPRTRVSGRVPCTSDYKVVRFVEGAMTLRCRVSLSVLLLCLCGTAVAQTCNQVNAGVPLKEIRVTLLGTASGPRVHVGVAGIRTLVEAGGERFLFDAGGGFMQRLVQAGFPMDAVTKLFVTHLHSDHISTSLT